MGFSAQSLKDWVKAAEKELRGKPLDSISWDFEGITIGPYQNSRNGQSPFSIRKVGANNDWKIRQDFSGARALELAKDAIAAGTQIIGMPSGKLAADAEGFMNHMANHDAGLVLLDEGNSELMAMILKCERSCGKSLLWEVEGTTDHVELRNSLGKDRFTPICVVDSCFGISDSGSESFFELALALASGHHSLVQLMSEGMTVDEASAQVSFKISVGGTYLVELCKWRVFRRLWAAIVEEYNPENSCSVNTRITASLSTWNKTVIDVDGNLIRQAAESMAAAIGGADVILISPFDHRESSRASRLARNIHHLLKGESWLTHVKDPVSGSYFFEDLSEKIANKVWSKFQELDSDYEELMNDGGIRNMLNEQRENSIERLRNQEEIRIGGNKYQPADIQSVADITTSTSAWEKEGEE